ncbi:MAG: HAMP domain-containing histidine kinase [Acidobacteriia bacterium]|nr:HAMP domain-containing histidine kinase [Terriglobia bacterium]
MGIKVGLISRDRSIAQACQEALGELFGPAFTLTIGSGRETVSQVDLCIWDYIPGETEIALQPADMQRLQSHFFVVQRTDVAALQELAGSPNLNLLLKPLAPAALRAFLGEASRRWRERDKDFAASRLRAERDEMLQCLMQANLRLQEYDQDRTIFLARFLHDLGAPLTAISGYCGLLLDDDFGHLTVEQQEALERMQYSVRRLSRMTNAMVQLSVSQSSELQLCLQRGDVRACVERALEEVAPFLEEKRISVTVDVEPSELLSFDKAQVEQMLFNLLDNACKFTPRGGTIDIQGHPFFWDRRIGQAARLDSARDRRMGQTSAPNFFRVDIHDSGPGVPTAHLDKIFEESTSYSGGQDRSGGGLGLAICKMIVRQHQGRIWAGTGPAGAVFSFVLPYQRTGANAGNNGCGPERTLSALEA